jgi:CheY-like chemotaxis protein
MVRILVIDDDALIRETLKTMLQLEGHEVTPHGEEGVRHFREQAVDLVICDNLHAEARQDGDDRGDPQRLPGRSDHRHDGRRPRHA